MEILHALAEYPLSILTAVGIIGGLFFDGLAHRSDARAQRIANQISLTAAHREIWKQFLRNPELTRVLEAKANLKEKPVTQREELFVNMLVQHLGVVFYAMRDDLTVKPEGVRRDVAAFFSLPVPHAVWERLKPVQNDRFVAFVEMCLNGK